MELKEKLVALRKEKGLTQLAVAEKLDVSRQAISRWESGVALPSTDNLKSLSVLYGVPVDYLLNSDVEREHTQVQTDMHCGEQATPQKMDKRKTKRVIIGLAIFLLVVAVVLALIKERHKYEFFHLIGICISVSEGISFIKICRNRKNAEMYVDIIGPYRNQFLISQAILFAIGAMIYPITFLMRIEDGLGSAVYLFIISFRRIMLWAYKKRYSVQK